MTIEQIVEIPANHRLVLTLPKELPQGRAKVAVTITAGPEVVSRGRSVFGSLRRFANPSKIAGEQAAWTEAALRKQSTH